MTIWVQNSDQIGEISRDAFRKLTGAEWVDCMQVQDGMELRAVEASRVDQELMHLFLPLYRAYRRRPPRLCIRAGASQGGLSVHAHETIPKGSVVVEYLGEWVGSEARRSSYRWGPIDGLKVRNFGALVEDGFPNCTAIYLYGIDELPLRVIFVALEEIKAGEMITIHYGLNHSVKLSYHTEYRLDAMVRFFERNPLEKIVKRIKELRGRSPKELGLKKTLELENLITKLRYLYHTPSALFSLLSLDGVFHYLKQAEVRTHFLNFSFTPSSREQAVMSCIEVMEAYLSLPQKPNQCEIERVQGVRQRLFFQHYLKGVVQGEGNGAETLLWNEVFDAIFEEEREVVAFKLGQAEQPHALIQASIAFAKEIESPLLPYLLSLGSPPLPLRPAS